MAAGSARTLGHRPAFPRIDRCTARELANDCAALIVRSRIGLGDDDRLRARHADHDAVSGKLPTRFTSTRLSTQSRAPGCTMNRYPRSCIDSLASDRDDATSGSDVITRAHSSTVRASNCAEFDLEARRADVERIGEAHLASMLEGPRAGPVRHALVLCSALDFPAAPLPDRAGGSPPPIRSCTPGNAARIPSAIVPYSASTLIDTTIGEITRGSGASAFRRPAPMEVGVPGHAGHHRSSNIAYEVGESRPGGRNTLCVGIDDRLPDVFAFALLLLIHGGRFSESLASHFGHSGFIAGCGNSSWLLVAFVLMAFNILYVYAPNVRHTQWHW